jgi:hypothetical protein
VPWNNNTVQNTLHVHISENKFFPTKVFQQKQHADVAVWRTLLLLLLAGPGGRAI